jgi:hypothetical protein
MNNRIAELAEIIFTLSKLENGLEQFARLIIQECANLFPSGDNGTTGIGTIINKHFVM